MNLSMRGIVQRRLRASAAGLLAASLIAGCAGPLDQPTNRKESPAKVLPSDIDRLPPSRYRETGRDERPELSADSGPDDYVRYALYRNPQVEAAYQRWRAAAERLPQVRALPDPRLNAGFFIEEVETRVGPQQARFGLSQTFPWPGTLRDREDAASRATLAAWRQYEAVRLTVTERVVGSLHDLAYLDAAARITRQNLELLESFEEVVRTRYRVGVGSHPELIRVQVALGQLEDKLAQLSEMRPSFVAELNASLGRESSAAIPLLDRLPERVLSVDAASLADLARRSNPTLQAIDERVQEQRLLGEVARGDGLPDLTVGLEYIVTGHAMDSSMPDSGKDPILLNFGINLPLWRDKYDSSVREARARRLALAHQREDEANRIAASIQRAYFEHTDADRRVRLYKQSLIPKAEESLQASLASFRAGDTSFLELLDTERTLLEFALAAERARADRGKALARLAALVGAPLPTHIESSTDTFEHASEVQQ